MRARFWKLILLLAECTLAIREPVNNTTKKEGKTTDNFLLQDADYDSVNDQEILFIEDRQCPRDCICTVSLGYRIAKCNRLEVRTQKFQDDITDLVIENTDPEVSIQLDDFIFIDLGLHRIGTVKIVNSTIEIIGANAFHGLHELYSVTLSNNKLNRVHPETFANNEKLLFLKLSNNPLKFPTSGSHEYFLNASSIQELDVSYCNMQYITANTFKNMPGLMYLNVAGNNLSDMHADTFKKLLDLEELDLSDNAIQTLPEDIFSENTELATMHIQRNPIRLNELQISELLTLNAGQTDIQFVGPSMFNGIPYIANLNLSHNSIKKIHNQAFHKLSELNYLDLSYNELDFISGILIKENIELDIFKISHNPNLKHLPVDGFTCSTERFIIQIFDASYCGLQEVHDDSLQTFTALSQINLSGNEIQYISNKVFSRCPKLADVNLAHNRLTSLEVKIFEKNKDLKKLNLQGNPLKVLSTEVFIHTPLLTWLDISNTELTSLWKAENNNSVKILSNLIFLNASYNRITEIKQSELDILLNTLYPDHLRVLDISNNTLVCSRVFENLMSWLSSRKVSPNRNTTSIANLSADIKGDEGQYSWEFLVHNTCHVDPGKPNVTNISAVKIPANPEASIPEETHAPVSAEGKIDQGDVGKFVMERTSDSAKISDDSKPRQDATKKLKDSNDVDDPSDVYNELGDQDRDGDNVDYEDDLDLKVKLIKEPASTNIPISEISSKDKLPLGINDNVTDEPQVNIRKSVIYNEHGHNDYLWPILIAVSGAMLLLIIVAKVVMVVYSKMSRIIY